MKILYLVIIIITVTAVIVGIYLTLPYLYHTFPINYTNLELVGINDTYNTGQIIKFQVRTIGYGIPCDMPSITIYKSDSPLTIVFEKKVPPLMCPIMGSTFFNIVYPGKNDTYSLTINDASKYTINVSFLNNEIKKEFKVK